MVKCEIVRHLADINTKTGLELNMVSWNGREPKLDLRKWDRDSDEAVPLKGLTLSTAEADALCAALIDHLQGTSDE